MSTKYFRKYLLGAVGAALISTPALAVDISLYYPVAVSGKLTELIGEMCADFNKEYPDITVNPVFSGNYADTLTKSLTAAKSGQPPQLAVLAASDSFTLIDEDVLQSVDSLMAPEDSEWLNGFMPAYMASSRVGDTTWGIPFQRSVQVMLYNKDLFKAAGLDPNAPPATWAELLDMSKKLTIEEGGTVKQWGVMIPSGVTARWFYHALALTNGADLTDNLGTKIDIDTPEAIEALQFLGDLSHVHNVMPKGIINTGTAPDDFIAGRTAMFFSSTGNVGNVRTQAKFEMGVALIPSNKRKGSPTGGGNMYIFKGSSPEQMQASLTFAKWMTSAEQAARWSIETGYIAARQDAWDTEAMKAYTKSFPDALVGLEQLKSAVPEFSTYNGARVVKALEDAISQVVTGRSDAKTALEAAQKTSERLLEPYQK